MRITNKRAVFLYSCKVRGKGISVIHVFINRVILPGPEARVFVSHVQRQRGIAVKFKKVVILIMIICEIHLFILVLCVRLCTAKLIGAFPRAAYLRLTRR